MAGRAARALSPSHGGSATPLASGLREADHALLRGGSDEATCDSALGFYGAVFNLVAGAVGAGLLAMPSVMGMGGQPRAGLAGGSVLLLVAAVFQRIANACICRAVDDAATSACGAGGGRVAMCASLEALAGQALGPAGRLFTSVVANLTTMGFAVTYLVLLGDSFSDSIGWANRRAGVGLVGLALAPLTFCPLSARAGFLAVGATFVMIPVIFAAAIRHGPGGDWTAFGKIEQLGPAFCTILFANGFGFLVPVVKAGMREPDGALAACDAALVICILLYGSTMLLGYGAWGNDVEGNVVDSMQVPALRVATRALILVNIVISYGIMMRCSATSLSESLGLRAGGGAAVALRLGLAALVAAAAVAVPCFNALIDLASALTLVACNFILPPACYWALRAHRVCSLKKAARDEPWACLRHLAMAVLGLLAMGFGIVGGIHNLVEALKRT